MEEERNLALKSGDYPDVFYGGGFNTPELVKYELGNRGVTQPDRRVGGERRRYAAASG